MGNLVNQQALPPFSLNFSDLFAPIGQQDGFSLSGVRPSAKVPDILNSPSALNLPDTNQLSAFDFGSGKGSGSGLGFDLFGENGVLLPALDTFKGIGDSILAAKQLGLDKKAQAFKEKAFAINLFNQGQQNKFDLTNIANNNNADRSFATAQDRQQATNNVVNKFKFRST